MRTRRLISQKEIFQLRLASLTKRRDANQPGPMPVLADPIQFIGARRPYSPVCCVSLSAPSRSPLPKQSLIN